MNGVSTAVGVIFMRACFLLMLAFLLIACGRLGAQHVGESKGDTITKMVEESKNGEYEASIQTGVSALENKPGDDVILRQIAIIYLIRAEKDREHAGQWVKEAGIFADRSLAINPAIDIGRYEAARIYEHSADLAKEDKCSLYVRALKTLAEWSSTLKGENLTVEGKDFPVAPLRKEADATKSRIERKQAQSHCE
jgi:hypothetical protein